MAGHIANLFYRKLLRKREYLPVVGICSFTMKIKKLCETAILIVCKSSKKPTTLLIILTING